MAKPANQPVRRTGKIDWVAARKWYLEDDTRGLRDVAKHFGVSRNAVDTNSKKEEGGSSSWTKTRHKLAAQAAEQHDQALVEDKAARSTTHAEYYRELQELAISKVRQLVKGQPMTTSRGRVLVDADGKPLMMVADGTQIEKTAKALQIAINGERVILGLPTSVAAMTGPDGSDPLAGYAAMLQNALKVAAEDDAPGS